MTPARSADRLGDREVRPPAWVRRAFAQAERWFDEGPPELRGRLAAVRARVARAQGQSSIEDALTARPATPFLALTEAYRQDLRLPDEGSIDAVGRGTLALYFYLRVQDDIIDEPALFGPSFAYAGEVLAGASAEAFASAVGGSAAFWSFRRAVLDRLAAVSAWELDVYRTIDPVAAGESAEADAARLGEKLLPIALPLAALAVIAGDEGALAWIRPAMHGLATALQIANDLLNARDDHAGSRLTPSLAALRAGGRLAAEAEPFRVWPALASDPALERMLRAARGHVARAAAIAAEHGAPALSAATARHAAILDEIPARLLALSLGVKP